MFSKMYLLSQREYDSIRQLDPRTKIIQSYNSELNTLPLTNMNDDERVIREADIMRKIKEAKSTSSIGESKQDGISSETIIKTIPKNYKLRAERLMHSLNPNDWSSTGQLIHNGSEIANSNIIDLVTRAVSESKRDVVGWQPFLDKLKKENVPAFALSNYASGELNKIENPETTLKKATNSVSPTSKKIRIKKEPTTSKKKRSSFQKGHGNLVTIKAGKLVTLKALKRWGI